jgi:hypothetical protein
MTEENEAGRACGGYDHGRRIPRKPRDGERQRAAIEPSDT